MYRVEFRPAAVRELRHLRRTIPSAGYMGLERAIDALAEDPRPQGYRAVANTPFLRIRVSGVYRVIYSVQEQERLVVVARVARRGEATYRRLA